MVVVPLASHCENRPRLIKLNEGSAHSAAQKYSRIVWVLRWLSKVKSKFRIDRRGEPLIETLGPVRNHYWLAEAPDALKVSGGSKKH